MRYIAKKTLVIDPELHSPEWEKAQVGQIAVNRWGEYTPAPDTAFRVLCGPRGISVLMHTCERNLRCECHTQNGEVYKDSCMEFFLKPDNHDTRYLNFEFNPLGILRLGLGESRHGRTPIEADREIFSIVSEAKEGDWWLKFYIPYAFLEEHFAKVSPVCRGNFYKCGDATDHVHYGAWSEVETPTPDFHVPDFFGKIQWGE